MRRVIILGSGFSKAVGNLPVTFEMFDRFKEARERCRSRNEGNRVLWDDQIFEFVRSIESQYAPRALADRDTGRRDTVVSTDFRQNFEFLLSLIDMNADLEITATFRGEEGNYTATGPPQSPSGDWGQVRAWIATYLYLVLESPEVDLALLDRFGDRFLAKDTTVITFNYDLILERYLFEKDLWSPLDGYGVNVEIPGGKQPLKCPKTSIPILKLHGSLNWKERLGDRLMLRWYTDRQQPYFPGFLTEGKRPTKPYQGGHTAVAWILPSWVKAIDAFPLPIVWRSARKALEAAHDIVAIGYSLPRADSAVVSLLTCAKFKYKTLHLIDPNAKKLALRYREITGLEIQPVSKTLSEAME